MLGQRNECLMNRILSSVGILLDKESRKYLTPRSVRSRNGPSHVMYRKYDNSTGWSIITVDSYVISVLLPHHYLIYLNPKITINENDGLSSGLQYIRLHLNVLKMRSLVHLY